MVPKADAAQGGEEVTKKSPNKVIFSFVLHGDPFTYDR